MSRDRLVATANRIATFFATRACTDRPAGVAARLSDFRDPEMRTALPRLVNAGAAGVHRLVHAAAERPGG